MSNQILTTVTPYWGRAEMLRCFVKALRNASIPSVRHFIYFVGEAFPDWWQEEVRGFPIVGMFREERPGSSIGFYHNLGFELAATPWVMKLDVDAMPNTGYFTALLPILDKAGPRDWFNGGMFYMNGVYSQMMLGLKSPPLRASEVILVMQNARFYSQQGYLLPQASNFICRRDVYLRLGGCDSRFRGWGWEDYQQLYMLERYRQGKDPLPGPIDITNVTHRCRDEIARPKAAMLWSTAPELCLMHRHHAANPDPLYKGNSNHNKQVLLDYILNARRNSVA